MRLYIASDLNHKLNNKWYIGFTDENISSIKKILGLQNKTSFVDIIFCTCQAKEIFEIFKKNYPYIESDGSGDYCIVEGKHNDLAQIIIDISKNYEKKHISLRNKFKKWLTDIESWEMLN